MATQDDYIRTALRVPPDLHAQIHEAAKGNNRTFNAEIVARLQDSFAGAMLPSPDEFKGSMLAKFAGRLHDLQGKRNALALVVHALKSSKAGIDEVLRVQKELEALDLAIGQVLVSIQAKQKSVTTK